VTIDRTSAAGLVASLFLVLILGVLIVQNSFPIFLYAPSNEPLVSVTQSVGPAESNFMWTYRYTDLIAQAVVLFAAAAGCLAMLRIEESRESKAG
jgi:hypothetical protein